MTIRTQTKLLLLAALLALISGLGVARRMKHEPGRDPRIQLPTASLQRANELSDAFVAIARSVTPAVVRIRAEHQATGEEMRRIPGHEFLDPQADGFPEIAGGTGFIVSADGYILTNNHVVEGAERILVTLVDKRQFEAKLVGRDPTTDVAVIKINATGVAAIPLGDSDQARVGEWVLAIGNPGFGEGSTLDFTVTNGIVSAKGRPLNILASQMGRSPSASYAIEDFIQTDAVINPGNSGGPLVDLDGAVIGINSAIASETGYNEGYGFAIPSNLARKVMKDLVAYGRVRRPVLGVNISDVTEEDALAFKLPSIAGVLVEDFSGSDSPALKAGMERGDVIVSIDGHTVDRVGELQRMVAQHQPGDIVNVGTVRYGDHHPLRVSLAEASLPPLADAPHHTQRAPGLGLEVGDAGRDSRPGLVVVTRVAPFSAASRKLEPGDRISQIDRVAMASADQAQAVIHAAHSGQVLSIFVQRPRDGRTHIANVRVP